MIRRAARADVVARTWGLVLSCVLAGCRAPSSDASLEAGADPSIGHARALGMPSARLPKVAPGPAPVRERGEQPTAEEATPTPAPRFVPIVPNPSPRSVLPCPAGTKLAALERSVSCRLLAPANAFRASQGPHLSFHPNGTLSAQGQYAGGRATGHWWYFREDGSLDYEVDRAEDEYDGIYVAYFPGGARKLEQHYRGGKLDGVSRSWREDGALASWSLYVDGRLARSKSFP